MTTISPKPTLAAMLAAVLLGGCVNSTVPLITDAQPVFGPDVKMHVYSIGDQRANGPGLAAFHWDGHEYRDVNKSVLEIAAFAAVPLAHDDLLIQSRSAKPDAKTLDYAIARRIATGVDMVAHIDEADADAATRATFCDKAMTEVCRVAAREGLMAIARAAAAKPGTSGFLAVLVGEDKP